MSKYLLVHGASHGAWCWEKVVGLLKKAGHTAEAIDLPGHGLDTTSFSDISMAGYVLRVTRWIDLHISEYDAEPFLLVGHSMGGFVISQAAELRPDSIDKLIYLSAVVPLDGQKMQDIVFSGNEANDGTAFIKLDYERMSISYDLTVAANREKLRQLFYGDCSAEDVAYALSWISPQSLRPFLAPARLTASNFGVVQKLYISCLQDQAVTPESQAGFYRRTPMPVLTLDSSHSPFFSNPSGLADLLLKAL